MPRAAGPASAGSGAAAAPTQRSGDCRCLRDTAGWRAGPRGRAGGGRAWDGLKRRRPPPPPCCRFGAAPRVRPASQSAFPSLPFGFRVNAGVAPPLPGDGAGGRRPALKSRPRPGPGGRRGLSSGVCHSPHRAPSCLYRYISVASLRFGNAWGVSVLFSASAAF